MPRKCLIMSHGVWAAGVVTLALVSGCSQTCTQAGTLGEYTLRSGSDTYDLRLAGDLTGLLVRNGELTGSFTWEWNNDQPFLNVSGAVMDRLDELSGRTAPAGLPKVHASYFGLDPRCRFPSHKAMALALGVDGDAPAFARVK